MLAKFPKGPHCSGCALETKGSGFAPAAGPSSSPILFVGEALGYNEAMGGEPFLGAAGGMLDRVFRRTDIQRPQIRIHNTCNCRPPDDWLDGAPWQHDALTHCAPYLEESLNAASLKVVVTLGNIPMRQVLGLWGAPGVRLQDFHGTVHRSVTDRYWIVPTYHPSHLQRGSTNLLDVVRHDIQVAQGILTKGSYSRRSVSLLQDPPVTQFRNWVGRLLDSFRHDRQGLFLDVDIETPDTEGKDKGELTYEDRSTEIKRVNFARSDEPDCGLTVPHEGPYLALIAELLGSGITLRMWNKGYDEPRLSLRGYSMPGEIWDFMWAAHHLQSDLPLGLGFWAPMYSDYGAWKHLGKQKGNEALYGALDGLQTCRVANGITRDLVREGLWEGFYRHTHTREQYVLRPAHLNGCPISEPRLDAFHDRLQVVSAERLESINSNEITGTYKPKEGYRKKPEGPPPASVVGKAGAKGDQAKQDYMIQGTTLVEREVSVVVKVCLDCGKRDGIGPKHNCLRPKKSRVRTEVDADSIDPPDMPQPSSRIEDRTSTELRWFWKLPFNPDASAQILAFIKASGEAPGKQKKTKRETGDKATLKKLAKKTGNPVYTHLLEYKAVKKVDSTYAIGSKKRIWSSDARIHPSITFRPSMFRDSCINPNWQNVIADKEGKDSLAAGFRHCVVADPGYRLIEIDYGGIEGIDTGWMCGDPNYIRLATLGVHAYLTSHLLAADGSIGEAASLSWSDDDLAKFFKEIKKKFPLQYDKSKRCVHGNNYGLTIYGMVENFPDVYKDLKDAEKTQGLYYDLCPKLPEFHSRVREFAYEHETLGGSFVDDYHLLTRGSNHPFSYRHKFFGVQSLKPITQSEYAKLQWIARKKLKRDQHPSVRIINHRPFQVKLGEDSKRVIAFYPQSIAAGTLKEAELNLFHPDSPTYMGDIADGKTPLVAPIHDSLLLHVPDYMHEWAIGVAVEVMRRPILGMPCPEAWGIGSHIRVNVEVKVSPVGGSWADVEVLGIPGMAPATAMESAYLPDPDAPDEWDDFTDLETRIA